MRVGAFASEEEAVAVAVALRDYLARVDGLRALIDEGLGSGEPVDGRAAMDRVEAELEARVAAELG